MFCTRACLNFRSFLQEVGRVCATSCPPLWHRGSPSSSLRCEPWFRTKCSASSPLMSVLPAVTDLCDGMWVCVCVWSSLHCEPWFRTKCSASSPLMSVLPAVTDLCDGMWVCVWCGVCDGMCVWCDVCVWCHVGVWCGCVCMSSSLHCEPWYRTKCSASSPLMPVLPAVTDLWVCGVMWCGRGGGLCVCVWFDVGVTACVCVKYDHTCLMYPHMWCVCACVCVCVIWLYTCLIYKHMWCVWACVSVCVCRYVCVRDSFCQDLESPKLTGPLVGLCASVCQSLEFVAETRILAEMKIKNHGKFFFSAEKQIDKHTFFLKQSVGVAESIEITPWTNASLPAKSSVDGVIVRGHLHISSYLRDRSIRRVLIGQKSLLNQWTSILHSKLNGS